MSLAFSPLMPWPLIAGFAALALAAIALGLYGRQPGAVLRALAFAALITALADPRVVIEERERLPDTVALVVDRSGSQRIGERTAQTEAARVEIERRLTELGAIETRVVEVDDAGANDGTKLFSALESGLSDVPRDRLAGVILLTDGIIHDVPASARTLGITAPVHALITGRSGERDRRIELVEAPRFGIVGREQRIRARIFDTRDEGPIAVVVRRDGVRIAERTVRSGETLDLAVRIEHAGANVIELEIAAASDELTRLNNTAVVTVEGVRDKLRVLLVSGEPHAGERTWRNLLKSDPAVELVHFTILRPPEKQDGTPINELSLIAFPVRDLFQVKIKEFDLIIFDRYANTSILPLIYFDSIVNYVRGGGAVLMAAGPEFAGLSGLWNTPLGRVLPARPNGRLVETPYRAQLTDDGRKHPVTRVLPGALAEPPAWGEWVRLIGAARTDGRAVMSGPDADPLLILSRVEQGRVGLLLSDHAWLWARGFRGGGPHLDLLRRLSHWLMKEPDLEEEALRASVQDRLITIERGTMADTTEPLTVESPTGAPRSLDLAMVSPGQWRATVTANENGLHRVRQGDLVAFVAVGAANPREFREVVSRTDMLAPLTEETAGSVRRIEAAGTGAVDLPRIVSMRAGAPFAGANFIGIRPTDSTVVRGITVWPLFIGLAGLLILTASLIGAWLAEGRGRRRARA
jgi:hypothetical protein